MRALTLAVCALFLSVPASAQLGGAPIGGGLSEPGFQAYLPQLRARALREGVRPATVDAVLPTLSLNPRVVELDRAQPGGVGNQNAIPPFAPYQERHVSPALISRGQTRYQHLLPILRRKEDITGVPPSIAMAIYGHETSYGTVTGDFDLLRSLATLAYEGRRRALFEEEFVATLKLMERGIPRSRLKGSWAGATGYPQFLPSMVLRLGTDGDGDGRADIWTSEADAIASIATYLRNAGWKRGTRWGVPVRVPATLNRGALATRLKAPRCERVHGRHSRWQSMDEWRRLGVQPLGATLAPGEQATLLEPDGPGRTAYLLTTNYRSILDYNCSNFYALSVGLLADAIAR